jgi:hypothetical protein
MFKLNGLAFTSLLVITQGLFASPGLAADAGATAKTSPSQIVWQTDYRHAVNQAIDEHKMLVIYFEGPAGCSHCRNFETQTLATSEVEDQLSQFVTLKLPTNAEIIADGKPITLLRHAAFAEMLGRPGLAILDMTDKKSTHYHQVVSVLPFTSSKFASSAYTSKRAVSTLLTLPKGTLTQRTMVFAVRMHPEAPASTLGKLDTALTAEADSHSKHQASIGVQGHHNWDSRFQRINGKLPSGLLAQEVVAESWPGENLVEACEDCVHSWRQSPGHWGAVRARHPVFAFDIKRGGNGIWYATGLFGRR